MTRKAFKFKAQRPEAAWNYAVEQLFQQRNRELGRVKAAVAAASVPMPSNIVLALSQLNPGDVREALSAHPGLSLWEANRSYQTSFEVFRRAVADLIKVIRGFETAARDGLLFARRRDGELKDIEGSIQKELLAATNAAHSLVDHSTRQLQKQAQVSGYSDQLAQSFGTDGLHETIIGLRNILHHFYMLRPGWQWQKRFEVGAEPVFSFTLSRDSLLEAARDNREKLGAANFTMIEQFLTASPDKIDLRHLFEDYRDRAAAFHSWFSVALENHAFENVRDYERCLMENRNFATRTWWNAMLGNWLRNWKEPPNPYDHLPRYLTAKQLEEVYNLPMGSDEQVDKVIEFVDVDKACDDHIRRQAYELFRCAQKPAASS